MGTLFEYGVNVVSVRRRIRVAGVSGRVEGHVGGLITPGAVLPRLPVPAAPFGQEGVEGGLQTPPGGNSGDRSR